MVTLVLGDRGDPSVPGLVAALHGRGARVVSAGGDEVVSARPFGHVVADDGVRFRVRLAGGRGWTHRTVTGVVNRLRWLPTISDSRVPEADRLYAQQELTAITLSWLAALAERVPFVGRPSAGGLAGTWRYPAEWALLAVAAGLEPYPVRVSGTSQTMAGRARGFVPVCRALVVLGEVFTARGAGVPHRTVAGLCRLATLADADTLSIEFDSRGQVGNVDIVPDLRLGGAAAAARIAAAVHQEPAVVS